MELSRIFGRIYIPELENNWIEGVWLCRDEKSIYLEVPSIYFHNKNWEIILGEFNGIDRITFLNCFSGGSSGGAGGRIQRINVSYLIEGIHVKSSSELNFSKISFKSESLNNWIIEKKGIDEINSNLFQIPKSKEILNVKIDDFVIKINIFYSISYSYENLLANKECEISIEWEKEISISKIFEKVNHLKKLILFLTHKKSEFKNYFISKKDNEYFELKKPIRHINDNRFSKSINISYEDIDNSFSNIIKQWFEKEKLFPIVDLVLEKCFNSEMSVNGQFLNLCSALEIFQRNFGEEIKDNKNNYKEKVLQLIENEDENFKMWFIEKSQHWNNPTLKERIIQYKDELSKLINEVFYMPVDEFVKITINTRNDIVHKSNKKIFEGVDLFLASLILEYLLKLLILKQFGIDVNRAPFPLFENAKKNLDSLAQLNRNR